MFNLQVEYVYITHHTNYNYKMNSTNQIKNVLAIVASIAMIAYISSSVSAVQGHTPTTIPYGQIGQEDQAYFWHDGVLYINAIPTQGNGLFIAEYDIDQDYSIDQAIDRFGIDEDVTSFTVQPSVFSEVEVTYELDSDLQFQIVSIQ